MNKFNYSARSDKGELQQGEVEAASAKEAAANLVARGLIPVNIEEQGAFLSFFKSFKFTFFVPKVKPRELNVLFRQLAVLVGAGVPLLECLIAVEDQISSENLKKIVRSIATEISGGSTFSQALSKYPAVFSNLVLAMVEAGEKSGTLEESLNKITTYFEKEIQMRQKIQAALRYPTLVMIALAIAFVVIITVVVPKFSAIFGTFKTQLPLPTRILLGINYAIVNYWLFILVLGGLLYFLVRFYISTPPGRRAWDQLQLRFPVFGLLISKVALSRFFRMLATMIGSGVPIVSGLEITANTADNVVIMQSIFKIRERVIGGAGLSGPLREEKIFPSTAIQMVAIGEKSGTLEKMLNKSADYFDEEADYLISNLMSLLEPFIILVLGIAVLTLALGVFLPMWSMMNLYSQ